MKPRKNNRILASLLTLLAFSQSISFTYAGQIWDGTGADSNWNTPANWDSDTLPNFNNSITFAGSTKLTNVNNLTAATTVGGISFTNTATNAFTISGNQITLGGNISTTAASSVLTDTTSFAIALNAARTITTNTNHNLTISGVISGSTFGIVKAGAAMLTLSGVNTYTGTTSINAGVLRLNTATSLPGGLGSTGGTSHLIFNGGVLGLNMATAFNRSYNATTTTTTAFSAPANQGPGWAAYGGERTVNVGGASAAQNWYNGKPLNFGAADADGYITYTNPMNNTTVTRQLNLVRGTGTIDVRMTGAIGENAGALTGLSVSGNGIAGLTANNTFTGNLIINNTATIIGNNLANAGTASSIGQGSHGITLNGGTFRYAPVVSTGATGATVNRNFFIAASGTLDASGTGALVLNQTGPISADVVDVPFTATGANATMTLAAANPNLTIGMRVTGPGVPANTTITGIATNALTLSANITSTSGMATFGFPTARTLTLTGTNTDANTIAGVLQNSTATGSGQLSLAKTGAGRWVLTGNNTFTGAVTVTGGTLTMAGSGAVNGSSGITVNASTAKFVQNSSTAVASPVTQTLGTVTGSATIDSLTVANSASNVITNNDGVAGASLTVGTLNFLGAATVNTFHTAGNFAATVASTNLSTNAAGLVTINPSATSWTNGTYHLLGYSGSVGGAGAGQVQIGTVSGLSGRQNASALINTGSSFAVTISGDTPKWTGADSGNWQTGTTGANENWQLVIGGTPTTFLANDDVLFDDSASGSTTINVSAGNVAPFATTFNNSSKNYTLGSSGGFGISSGRLTKTGSGTLTVTNTNTYTGNTVISGGILDVSTDGAQLYSSATSITGASVTVTTGGVLVVKNFGQASTTGAGSPSLGNLLNNGGQVIIDGGTLRFNNETSSRGRVINVGANGATLDVVNSSAYACTATSFPFAGSGQTLTLTGESGSTGTIQPVIGGTNVSLVKNGASTWFLTGANTYTGGTTVNTGTLQATVTTTVNSLGTGSVSVASGSTLILNNTATSGTILVNNVFTGSGLLQMQFAANATARNTQVPNVAGFSGVIRLSSSGSNGDKWNATGVGAVSGSLLIDSGNTLYVVSGTTSFNGITLSGTGNSEGRGVIRLNNATLGGNITLMGDSTINMDNTGALVTGGITSGVAAPLTLTLGATGSTGGTLSGVIGGGLDVMNLATAVGGTYTLSNANSYAGITTVASGTTLRLGTGSSGGDGSINSTSGVTNNGTLTFNPFGSIASSYPISGSGAIVKNGAGSQSMGGQNSFSGTTTVNAGTLTLDYSTQDNNKLSDTAVLNLSGGTLNLSGGSHTEVVASTNLANGTASTVSRSSGAAILQMGLINRVGNATINFAQSGIATTDTLNNADGYIGAWATVNGTDLAVNSTNDSNGLITAPVYSDVTRLSSGTKVIPDNASGFVRIIEGTGTAGDITLAAAVTSMSTLTQSAVGGNGDSIIDPAGQTLATSVIFAPAGAGALTIGNGTNNGTAQALVSGGDLAVNNLSASPVTIQSVIADNNFSTLSKIGSGALALNGNNNYQGGTTLTEGTLLLGNAGALGLGSLTIAGGNLDGSAPNIVLANANPIQWNSNFTFVGSQNLNLGTGAVTTNAARSVTVAANALTMGGDITPSGIMTKLGNGTLVLNGTTALGNHGIIVNGGTVRFGGTMTTNTGAGGAGNTFRVGNLTNASAAWVQTGGSITLSVNDVDGMNLGNADSAPNAFGSMTIASGSFSAPRINVGGSGVNAGTNGVGIMNLLNGGSATFSAYFIGGRSAGNTGSATIAGGSLDLTNAAIVSGRIGAWGNGRMEANIGANLGGLNTGGTVNTGANPYSAVANGAAGQGIVNLLGGTLTTNGITSPAGASTGTGINQFNFNGGTLKYGGTAANAAFFNAIAVGAAGTSGAFVRSGGAIIDSSGQAITMAAALLAPTGGEITSISVTGVDAPGTFFTAPYVRITGGNNDATAIARINDDGSLHSIIVTNPGSGYTLNPPSVTLLGGTHGGGSNTVTGSAVANVGASTSGALTKIGASTLTLTGANTYTGGTNINVGEVAANNSSALGTGAVQVAAGSRLLVTVNNITLANNITLNDTATNGAIYSGNLAAGNVTNLTGTITLAATANVSTWWNDKTLRFSGKITGAGGLDFILQPSSVGGRYFITGADNDYLGNTSVTGSDTPQFGYTGQAMLYLGATNALPVTTSLSLNHADLYLNGQSQTLPAITGTGTFTVQNGSTSPASLTLGAADTSSTFAGAIRDNGIDVTNTSATPATVTGTVSLTKIGTGTLTLTGTNTYTGATAVTAGTLAFVGGSQASPVTVSAGASLGFTLESPTTSTGTFNLSAGTIKITGTPTLNSYDLISSSAGITGTPVLDAPITGYELKVDGNSLKLVKAGYASWAAVNAIGSAANLDKDADGVSNGVEYVLGGDVNTNDLGKLPTLDASGANLVFTFKRDRDSLDGSTAVVIEVGDNLTGWPDVFTVGTTTGTSTAGVTVTESSPAGFDTITLSVPKGVATKKFARLKVTVTE